jgi:RNA polymerase sigma-70 factor (ECF subfamily)
MMPPNADDLHGPTAATLRAEGGALQALARSLVGADDAEDVVQDAAVAALRTPPQRLGSWLSATVRNLAHMRRRSAARRRAHERAAAVSAVDEANEPAAIAAQAELARAVSAAVAGLDEPFRTAVVMRFWRGMKPEAIAAELSVPRNTVRSRLQRGLEAVRVRLDQQYGKRERWSAPMLLLAHVREGSAVASGGVALWLVGGLMQVKVLVGAAAVVVAVAAVSLWSPSAASAPANATSRTTAAVAADSQPTSPLQREIVDSTAPRSGAPVVVGDAPERVAPWVANLLVVDEDQQPVADAVVTLWVAKVSGDPRHPEQRGVHMQDRHTWDPLLVLSTDATGHASIKLEFEACYAIAGKPEVGKSEEVILWHTTTASTTTKLRLLAVAVVTGRALQEDGVGASGAIVTVESQQSNSTVSYPEPIVADAEGRFRVQLQRGAYHTFVAHVGSRSSFPVHLRLRSGPPPEVLLTFPGAITITGLVMDADRKPVAGARVTAWREFHLDDPAQDPDAWEKASGTADSEGRFAIAVQSYGRYQLLAAADGRATSNLVWTETTPERAHAALQLDMLSFAHIRGRIVHGDGHPFTGITVFAKPEAGEARMFDSTPYQEEMFPGVKSSTTAADGAFALQVHPNTSWTVCVRPYVDNWRFEKHEPGVLPGREDLVITLTDEDVEEVNVDGTVTRADGQPVGAYTIDLVECNEAGKELRSSKARATIDGEHFRLERLPTGLKLAVQVELLDPQGKQLRLDGPLAPARTPQFTISRHTPPLHVRLLEWGVLPVRVLSSDGKPVSRFSVNAVDMSFLYGFSPMLPDIEGRVTLRRVPGIHRLFVLNSMESPFEQSAIIAPGLNAEVVVRLPASVTDKTSR